MAFNNLLNIALLNELLRANMRNNENIKRRMLRDTSDPFQMTDINFIKYFRLSKDLTKHVITVLRPHMQGHHGRTTSIPLELKVLVALSFFGHGSYQKCVGQNFNLAVEQSSVSRIISDISDKMVEHLLNQWVVFPQSDQECNKVKERFMEKFNFPGVIGAIDCSHVAIVAPPAEDDVRPGLMYYNRKGFYSLNIQVICDADLRITNCNARYPGSVHDSAIWFMSHIKRHLQDKYVLDPLQSSWLIGDSGYALQPWLLTPIEGAAENTPEGRYTKAHVCARNTIERCFGVLKQRFRCLLKHRTLHYNPVRAGKIVYCCAILHNMAIRQGLPFDDDIANEIQDAPMMEQVVEMNEQGNENWLAQGRQIRSRLIRNYFEQ